MLDLLYRRRSIRRYKPQKIERELVDGIIEAALLSPSSRNIKPWEFVVIDDPKQIHALSESKKHGAGFLKDSPLVIAVIADTAKSDVWVEDASIASIIIQLEAEKLGLGSCWVQIHNRKAPDGGPAGDYIRNLLGIPEIYDVESIIGIGYPDENRPPYRKEDLQFQKVHYGEFKKP